MNWEPRTFRLLICTRNGHVKHKIKLSKDGGMIELLDECNFLIDQEISRGNIVDAAHVYNPLGAHIFYQYFSKGSHWCGDGGGLAGLY